MLAVHRKLKSSFSARLLLQIHDELIFEVPTSELDELARTVRDEMSGVMSLAVPLKVDVKIGDNWAACEPW
jgi:DNA polymerase-1